MAVEDTTAEPPDEAVRRARYGLLLLAILVTFAFQGIANSGRWQQIVVTTLLATTLLLALRAANARPTVIRGAALVAIALVALSVVESLTGHFDNVAARIANLLLVTLAPPAVVVGVVRTLRARHRVTVEAVFGALCLYILVGMFFASVYSTADRIGHQFFAENVQATLAKCLYFSFTTLTTTGYGDLTARTNFGHTVAVSEALLGQIYLVTVVGVIVGNITRRPRRAAQQ